jgi:hypothetical protein
MLCRFVICLLVILLYQPFPTLAAPIALSPASPQTANVGINPQAGILADVNGNGKLDLITANADAGTISVLLGNGNGTFAPEASYVVGTMPNALVAANLDGDADLDLVVVNGSNDNVVVLRNNGAGVFTTVGGYPTGPFGSFPNGVAAGDFDSDGDLDLAVANFDGANYAGDVAILPNNGNGTFEAATHLVVTNPKKIIAGDFNNDGKADLATANAGPNKVSVLLGDGAGAFAAAVNYAVGSFPVAIAAGDLDSDGDLDLVTANQFGNTISILRGNGNGAFGAATSVAAGSGPVSVTMADFNLNGMLDVVVADNTGNTISLFNGNGNGTFQAATSVAVGLAPTVVASGDLTGDGLADLIVANSSDNDASVFRNTTSLPVWTAGYPQVGASSATTAQISANADRAGTAYLVCLPAGAAVPTSFQVRAGKNAANATLATNLKASAVLAANTTATLSCTALTPGSAYALHVVAADSQGSLQAKPAALAFPLQVALPGALVVPAADADGAFVVNWGASVTPGVSYELQEATNSAFTAGLRTAYTGTGLSANIVGRGQNATYYYRLRAIKSGYLTSDWRSAVNGCAVPGATQITIPASLTVPVADTDGAYTINWGASTTAGVIYELQEATASNFSTGLRIAYRGTALTTAITGRSQNATYYYRVRAVKAGLKDSGYRVAANGCAVPGAAAAGIPASLTVPVADADGGYTVSWGASATAGVAYELQEATVSNFSTGLRTAYRGTALTTAITGRSQNVTYYYRVRAMKAGLKDSGYRTGVNSCAVPGTVTTGVPASLTVPGSDVDGGYIVGWGASATAGVTYELYEATNNTFTTGLRLAYRGAALTAGMAGRVAGNTYYYRVRAVKGGLKDSGYRTAGNGCRIGP